MIARPLLCGRFQELGEKLSVAARADGIGGAGMTLAEVCREQRRLAYQAPATALAVNMHLYWLGVAADLWRSGDASSSGSYASAAGENLRRWPCRERHDVPVPAFAQKRNVSTAATIFYGPQAFWQPDARLDPVWACNGMDTSTRASRRLSTRLCRAILRDTRLKKRGMCWHARHARD